ncbi:MULTISPECIES: ATP-binding cassette domain-containing protein [Caballeronia]|uniref:ATP-binding cassette domain-containing protein n=1 Tax=Caballeronia TaxID=1827195 RepID=UPI00158D68D8|nr:MULTISPECIES: ATP-binding cassette domain-containing protein [Caballeronia]MCG7403985.1 ATP-binding cassette domain-containing protein [Caballeronia zhejiangensis]MCI1045446.1 ATP-binding cassette domain-containing protein [Caballeronia zhejiangensis]MDR5769302.1 ATP-binding cassette domain-containing protein [Caballeronia sp. LZ028]MDR5798449.1 ATP-binding cassette domain-containing protein [Caballeronia sp. LZ008]
MTARVTEDQERARLRRRIGADLWRAVWAWRYQTAAAVALMIGARLAVVGVPLMLKRVIDEFSHPASSVVFPVFLVLAYVLLRYLGDVLNEARDVVFSIVTQRTVASFTERTFAHLHALGARFHARRETGAVVRDVQKGADGIGFLLGTSLFTIVPVMIEIGTIVAVMVHAYSLEFMAIIGATFVLYSVWTVIFTRFRMRFQRAVNGLEAQSDGRLVDSLLNYETVKFFASESIETRRLSSVLEQWVHARIANQRALTLLHVGQSTIITIGIAAVMLRAAQHVVAGTMSVGDLVLVNAYIVQVCNPLNTLGFVFRETNDAMVNVERMFNILLSRGRVREDVDEAHAKPLVVTAGEIEFDHVEFGYDPARQILRDVDFRAHPGKKLAVVGGSGSGKSTLVKLLFRLYEPTAGAIRIDGQDISQVTQNSLRATIGIVPQDTVLFNDTIAYNIGYGRPGATRADIARAARAAQLDGFIERLPDDYETRVGERGVRLSGGERQRIAIARAILKNPRIIVFDEATSALDTRSERAIQNELDRLAEGRTSIVIAHRLSTVVDADWILVMEHGRIVEQGQHDELLARDGVYARMWSLQWQQGELKHAQRKVSATALGLDALVAGVVDALHDEIVTRGVNLYTVISDPGLRVSGDASVLQQIVADLCRSHMSSAARGERIELRVFREDNHANLTVIGQRASPADLSSQQMRRLESALNEMGGGFTVRYIDEHVAYVATMPLRPVLDDPQASEATHDDALAGITVMVLDDQEDARDALEAVLESVGARVMSCASGDEALARLRELPGAQWPDALLCDIVLGGEQNGYDVLRLIREEESRRGASLSERMPAIALTGHTQADARSRAQAAGFQAHLTKPVAAPKLIATIGDVTARTSLR